LNFAFEKEEWLLRCNGEATILLKRPKTPERAKGAKRLLFGLTVIPKHSPLFVVPYCTQIRESYEQVENYCFCRPCMYMVLG
jgi:hypothetical protein